MSSNSKPCYSPEPRCSSNTNSNWACNDVCEPKCECDEGYIRGFDGRCIHPWDCYTDVQCPDGEHFDQCASFCDELYCCPNTRCAIPWEDICHQSVGNLHNLYKYNKLIFNYIIIKCGASSGSSSLCFPIGIRTK